MSSSTATHRPAAPGPAQLEPAARAALAGLADLADVRRVLRQLEVDALVVPSSDPHQSEVPPLHWQGRTWLTGFDGSTGHAAITQHEAAVFTDARYWAHAERQTAGRGVSVVRIGRYELGFPEWLASRVPRGARVAVDGRCLAAAAYRRLEAACAGAGLQLVGDRDLLNDVWPDRPAVPALPVTEHPLAFATRSRAEKLARVRKAMAERGATHHLVATLDDIAWLTNLRGQDTWPIPLFTAFLLIGRERATLFTAPQRLTLALKAALSQDGIEVAPYDEALRTLAALPTEACLWVDGTRVGGAALAALPASVTVVDQPNPSTLHKACKSPAELDHLREALAEDCAAMAEVYAWFDGACTSGTVTELDVMHRLAEARARRPNFVSVANDPVVGFNANSLQYHRSPSPGDNARIRGEGVLLVDSGGQYLGGTTDVTRVLPVGPASDALRRDHTRVLKAVIALTELRFPRGTLSPMIDAIARAPLWAAGIDFLHATGHGVGYHLCVHEGPQSIARRQPHPSMAFEPGMVCTVEPSVERAGSYHLHIENMIAAVRWDDPEGGRYGEFLRFETLSMLPIDTRLVDPRLLRPDELVWLDRYHAEVRTRLRPLVDEPTWRWLDERTRPLAG